MRKFIKTPREIIIDSIYYSKERWWLTRDFWEEGWSAGKNDYRKQIYNSIITTIKKIDRKEKVYLQEPAGWVDYNIPSAIIEYGEKENRWIRCFKGIGNMYGTKSSCAVVWSRFYHKS